MWHYFRTKIADSAQPRKHSVVARPLSGWGLHTILYTVMNTWYAGCHSVWLISFLICCSQPLLIFIGIFIRSQHFWTSNMAIGRKLLGKKQPLPMWTAQEEVYRLTISLVYGVIFHPETFIPSSSISRVICSCLNFTSHSRTSLASISANLPSTAYKRFICITKVPWTLATMYMYN